MSSGYLIRPQWPDRNAERPRTSECTAVGQLCGSWTFFRLCFIDGPFLRCYGLMRVLIGECALRVRYMENSVLIELASLYFRVV